MLSQQFKQQFTKPKLLEIYTDAYERHIKEVAKMKQLITEVSQSIVNDLGAPAFEVTYDLTDEMRTMLDEQRKKL